MRYLSLFSGIGGFELGIQQSYGIHNLGPDELADSERPEELHNSQNKQFKWKCVGYSEIDKYATQIYQKHFPEHKNYGDITKIKEEDLQDFDLLCGGFPCQSFSIAGKRGGFNDTRGTLFFDIARILRAKQPHLLLLENVKGLLSHDEGRTFATIIATLDELGYDLQWQVLNSKNFGVPQNRERVFIIGHLRGTSRPKIFPITNSNSKNPEQLVGGSQGNRIYSTRGVSVTQASQAGGQGAKTGLYEVTGTLDANYWKGDNRENNKSNRPRIYDNLGVRRLTPTECERLQGFPDRWTEGISDTQRYKCLGNAVTVNVIKELIYKLI